MKELIVGGTAGVGLEIAKQSYHQSRKVIVTGSEDVEFPYGEVREFDFRGSDLAARIGEFVRKLPPIRTFIYTTLYHREGKFIDLEDEDDEFKFNVGLRGLHYFTKRIVRQQGSEEGRLEELIVVASAPHGLPRKPEAARYMIQGAVTGWAEGLTEENVVPKVLVVHPSDEMDSYMMSAAEIASRIMETRETDYRSWLLPLGDYPRAKERVLR